MTRWLFVFLFVAIAAASFSQEPPSSPPPDRPPSQGRSPSQGPPQTQERSLSVIIKAVSPAVVTIVAYNSAGVVIQQGSGFFVSDKGECVTNHHVVVGAAKVEVRTTDGKTHLLKSVLAENAQEDLAWFSVETADESVPSLRLMPGLPEVGERVVVISSPYGLAQTVSEGIVSATDRDLPGFEDMLQITAPISPGSSGAPVANYRGEIVGVVTAQMTEGQSLNFATPSKRLMTMMATKNPQLAFFLDESLAEKNPFIKGLTLMRRRQFAEARPYLEAALKEEKDVNRVLFSLARTYHELKDYPAALGAYQRLLETKRDGQPQQNDPFLHMLIGDTYKAMNESDKALESYSAAVQLKSDFVPAMLKLGEVYLARKQYDDATRLFQQANQLNPEQPWAHVWLGRAYAAQERYQDAVASYVKAIRLNSDDRMAHLHLGLAYIALGRRDWAFDEYRLLKPLDETMAATLFDAVYVLPVPKE